MKLSIVIPNWIVGKAGFIIPDGDELAWFAENCFKRIRQFTKDFELIVVDNGSTTAVDILKEYADIYIRNKENLGFGRACNQGFGVATGDYVICMNNDVFVFDGWSQTMVNEFSKDDNIGIISPRFTKGLTATDALSVASVPTVNDFGLGMEQAACWIIKRSFLEEIKARDGHYFDPNFHFGFGEDVDFWKRVRLAGKDLYLTGKVELFHQLNATLGKIPEWGEYTEKSMEYLNNKYK